jgi:hypothetical protein
MRAGELRLADVKDYTSFASEIDLTAAAQSKLSKAACYLYVASAGSGTLAIELSVTDGLSAGTRVQRTLTVTTGREFIIDGINKILTATNVAQLTVGWAG